MTQQPAALVTGGARGIGKAIVTHLAQLGYRVAINYASSADAALELAAALQAKGQQAVTLQGDVGQAADRQRLVDQTVAAFGRFDLLVNNAGITSPGRLDLLELTEASWEQVFAINLKGPFFLSQLAARAMLASQAAGHQSGGKIINISSISAYAVSTNRGDYCLTKAAQEMMTHLFAVRLADHNIGVFEICPGVIATDMTGPVKEKYDQLIADGMAPIRRWGSPDDIAKAVTAIAGDYFPFSTGQRFHVDGGFHIRRL